ncbi:sulfurtransferase TusA family protein [Pseudoalteromonas shioyasakiensis]|uniref:sulfurtransferase TusA family protein n=1 Tax=Pseudoalteromonas shioyasakiensis TaxID=1190813 RepID=UPI002118E716|nr:sulfurtransferase TusA family protein [Pseudoalteromonas shioyasakiensis]MCQ8877136.1 sulfurtransferase TusA family protein [Pseudoalteromonas shioyasakiensis]
MLEHDLRTFICPQQFIQFKLGLKQANCNKQSIKFILSLEQSTSDIERFLQKHHYQYKLEQQQGLLFVEPLRV